MLSIDGVSRLITKKSNHYLVTGGYFFLCSFMYSINILTTIPRIININDNSSKSLIKHPSFPRFPLRSLGTWRVYPSNGETPPTVYDSIHLYLNRYVIEHQFFFNLKCNFPLGYLSIHTIHLTPLLLSVDTSQSLPYSHNTSTPTHPTTAFQLSYLASPLVIFPTAF
jgi:hypothetical protein